MSDELIVPNPVPFQSVEVDRPKSLYRDEVLLAVAQVNMPWERLGDDIVVHPILLGIRRQDLVHSVLLPPLERSCPLGFCSPQAHTIPEIRGHLSRPGHLPPPPSTSRSARVKAIQADHPADPANHAGPRIHDRRPYPHHRDGGHHDKK
eukprot:CAMPEP_0182529034 /NCGR_PEP_ID=MMETSP1323-20130603/4904_1 /TAXON_ID=236787 /ORGANISM="Florenciella parvula, Strain RCC1693" /LENGTH=148 /DNA_ID=CAMNT_0024738211 /DNA_START=969 /DNA_END=1415 /DNA_ORIENTATION=+